MFLTQYALSQDQFQPDLLALALISVPHNIRNLYVSCASKNHPMRQQALRSRNLVNHRESVIDSINVSCPGNHALASRLTGYAAIIIGLLTESSSQTLTMIVM